MQSAAVGQSELALTRIMLGSENLIGVVMSPGAGWRHAPRLLEADLKSTMFELRQGGDVVVRKAGSARDSRSLQRSRVCRVRRRCRRSQPRQGWCLRRA
jgi:hypothetical protein